jgi:hypothetical protein
VSLAAMAAGSAGAQSYTITTTLRGADERPNPVVTPATGTGTVVLNLTNNTLRVTESFSGLSSPVTGAHIHCCAPPSGTAPVAIDFGAAGFPTGTSGSFDFTFNLGVSSTFSAGFLNQAAFGGSFAVAQAAFVNGVLNGQSYLNIHTQPNPGGEIRGNLAAVVPEPSTYVLLASGLAGVGLIARRRRA